MAIKQRRMAAKPDQFRVKIDWIIDFWNSESFEGDVIKPVAR